MADRKQAERRGRRAEQVASLLLQLKGYSILARRARTPSGEIDLIARRGKLLAFVEVKARATQVQCLEAVTPTARSRIGRAAELWMARRSDLSGLDWRFDIIAVTPRALLPAIKITIAWPKHFCDAWRPDFTITGR